MSVTTSIRPGHPYGMPEGCLFEGWADEEERAEVIARFYSHLDALLREATGDPTIEYIPATGEVVFECRGQTDEDGHCLDSKNPWIAVPNWEEIWARAGELAVRD